MTPVVGRRAELEALESFLSRVGDGFGCLVLEGEAGIGKTTLWRAGVERAIGRGFTVLTCGPARAEQGLPFNALGDLLDRIDDEVLARLPGPQRRALEVALLREDPGARPPEQRAVAVALLSLLRDLGRSARVLVAIDDAQWADPATLDVLRFAARRLATEPVGMLVATRPNRGRDCTSDCVVGEDRRHAIRLQGLAIPELHELLSVRLQHVLPRPTLVRIGHASNGNPLHAQEIAREMLRVDGYVPCAPLPAPADVRHAVDARMRLLPEPTRAVLLAAAAMSYQPTTSLDADESTLRPAIEADIARVAQDGRITFAHPLYASAIYESEPMASRRDLHRRMARLVVDDDERARHLALSSSPPDENVARTLESGAERARERGAWQFAAELLEQATAFTPPDRPDARRRRSLAAAELHAHAGDRTRASNLLEGLQAQEHDAPARAQALCLMSQIRGNDESFTESLRLLEEARRYANDEQSIASIELDRAYACWQAWDFERTAAHVARALELTPKLGDDGLHAMALAYSALSGYLRGNGIDWVSLDQAVALEDPHRIVPLPRMPSTIHGLLLLLDGRLVEARERLEFVYRRATERGDESDTAYILSWLAWLETQAGNLPAARARADEALLLATSTGSISTRALALACRATVNALLGDVERARRESVEANELAEQTTNGVAARMAAVARCTVELCVGNAAAAWQAAESLLPHSVQFRGRWEPSTLLFLPDAVEALIALGELDRAGAILDAFQERARALDRAWAVAMGERGRGLLLAARGDLRGAALHVLRAIHEFERLEMPFELGRTLLCAGQLQRRRKLRKSARAALEHALELFERVGIPVWAAQARAELDRTHLREAPSDLSPSELRVAELAGGGLTNRQIATRLFLSPKTVEANLARAYAKLGIRSRAELGARMVRDTPN
jgi:DNA-binding CsgD family transcriptional regulator